VLYGATTALVAVRVLRGRNNGRAEKPGGAVVQGQEIADA
jgi:hypothetical protein